MSAIAILIDSTPPAPLHSVDLDLIRTAAVDAAARAADAIDQRMRGPDGTLRRTARGTTASIPAFLEDYAFLIRGRLALAKAEEEAEHRARAEALFEEAIALFADPRGGFFDSREGANELFVRSRSVTDGALPGGNGIMLLNALDLLAATGKAIYRSELTRSFAGLSGVIAEQPVQTTLATLALWRASREAPETLPRGAAADDGLVRVTRVAQEGARITLRIVIAPGFHINAHDPGDASLVGLAVALRGGGTLEVDYPAGETYGSGLRVHRGTVDVACRVVGGTAASRIEVTVQACDDTACRRPRTIVVE